MSYICIYHFYGQNGTIPFLARKWVRSGLEKFILKFIHAQNYFPYFIKVKIFAQKFKLSNKVLKY